MGWDIHCACQYIDNEGEVHCAEDYQMICCVGEHPEYQVLDPAAEFRNYNLFRPLIGAHNTKQHIDRELDYWKEFRKNSYSEYGRYTTEKLEQEMYPETNEPADVIEAYEVNMVDGQTVMIDRQGNKIAISVDPVVWSWVFEHSYEDTIRVVSLEQLEQFCDSHPHYRMLQDFLNKINKRYIRCNEFNRRNMIARHEDPIDIDRTKFYIFYGFDY